MPFTVTEAPWIACRAERTQRMNRDSRRFICLMPDAWAAVHRRLLSARERAGDPAVPEPPRPLILDGWAFSSDTQKQERWKETVRWVTQHGFRRLIPTIERRHAYQAAEPRPTS